MLPVNIFDYSAECSISISPEIEHVAEISKVLNGTLILNVLSLSQRPWSSLTCCRILEGIERNMETKFVNYLFSKTLVASKKIVHFTLLISDNVTTQRRIQNSSNIRWSFLQK